LVSHAFDSIEPNLHLTSIELKLITMICNFNSQFSEFPSQVRELTSQFAEFSSQVSELASQVSELASQFAKLATQAITQRVDPFKDGFESGFSHSAVRIFVHDF